MVLQTEGATPLSVASQSGHVECVQALLIAGATINQAKVGRASSMARHWRELHARGYMGACMHACMRSSSGALGCYEVEA
jgi:hypothetical protein